MYLKTNHATRGYCETKVITSFDFFSNYDSYPQNLDMKSRKKEKVKNLKDLTSVISSKQKWTTRKEDREEPSREPACWPRPIWATSCSRTTRTTRTTFLVVMPLPDCKFVTLITKSVTEYIYIYRILLYKCWEMSVIIVTMGRPPMIRDKDSLYDNVERLQNSQILQRLSCRQLARIWSPNNASPRFFMHSKILHKAPHFTLFYATEDSLPLNRVLIHHLKNGIRLIGNPCHQCHGLIFLLRSSKQCNE